MNKGTVCMTDHFKARIKVKLLSGARIKTQDGWTLFRTTRLSEYIRRLRKDGLNILTDMVLSPNSRQKRGVYYIPRTTKKCRIVRESKLY